MSSQLEHLQPFLDQWHKHVHDNIHKGTDQQSAFDLFNREDFKYLFANTHIAILVINMTNSKYEFMSDSIEKMIGYTSEEFIKGQISFGFSLVYPPHAEIYQTSVFPKIFQLINEQVAAGGDARDLYMSFDFKMRRKDGEYIWIREDMSIIDVNSEGQPLLTMYLLNDISHEKRGNEIEFNSYIKNKEGFTPRFSTHFTTDEKPLLSPKEQQILVFLSDGKSSRQIADQLCISVHTVSTHRRNMLAKLQAASVTELLKIALEKGLL